MISLDTETTGLDLRHGARPFFVTTCDDEGNQAFWEWDVDPLTRMPIVPEEDVDDIAELLSPGTGISHDRIVLQNCKFDVAALASIRPEFGQYWRWEDTEDTLLAGHLLASNRPHNLTDMAVQYLGVDIEPYEVRLKQACDEARRLLRKKVHEDLGWRLAKKGLPEMPSAKESCWKYDTWLPRAVAKHFGYESDHPWWTVLSDYANADSAVTISLWKIQRDIIKKRGLWEIYQERRKVLPVVYEMERLGVTLSGKRLEQMIEEYGQESVKARGLCEKIAASCGYELTMPKSGNSRVLRSFIFDGLKLPALARSQKTGEPSLDKKVLEAYSSILEPNSRGLIFVNAMRGKRKRDTALAYMDGYKRFMVPIESRDVTESGVDWYHLFPSLNPTGTDTLRWSSSNPNEQNISKLEGFNLRYVFGPAPGREWWTLDAKNIELRLPAYEAQEEAFIALFERPDDPPYYGSNHLLVAHLLFPREFEACKTDGKVDGRVFKKKYASSLYQRVKNGNFAVQYGAVDREDGQGTADRTYGVPGAQARIKARFKKQEALNQRWIRFAEEHGYVETMPDKTVNPKRGYPLLCTRTEWGRILPTVPLNYHVQGTAMWWMQKAMVRCWELFSQWNRGCPEGKGYYIVMQVHDELAFDFPRGKTPTANLDRIKEVQYLMERGGDDIGVPTPVSIEYHAETWSEGVSYG